MRVCRRNLSYLRHKVSSLVVCGSESAVGVPRYAVVGALAAGRNIHRPEWRHWAELILEFGRKPGCGRCQYCE